MQDTGYPERLMTSQTVALVLGKSPRTVRQMAQDGTLPVVRLPRSRGYRFRPSAIDRFIADHATTSN